MHPSRAPSSPLTRKILLFLFGFLATASSFIIHTPAQLQQTIGTRHRSPCSISMVAPAPLEDTAEESDNTDDNDNDLESFQQRQALKLSLLFQAKDAKRGFGATNTERKEILDIITQLSALNPTAEPAAAYYENNLRTNLDDGPTLSGKWTLVYTDAPDITSLDPSSSSSALIPPPPPSAKLGRIGQECDAGENTISNIIEWKRPDWLGNILNNGNEEQNDGKESESRVLQKVVCEASASPEKPFVVDLKLVGFELVGETDNDESGDDSGSASAFPSLPGMPSISSILNQGPAAILAKNPVSLRGPLKAPFGMFEIQYLDEEMRIIKTGQGYYAVNLRDSQPWF
jgi:hypothetical protein